MASGVTTMTTLAELIPEITLRVDYLYQNAAIGRALVDTRDISGIPGKTVEWPRLDAFSASTSPAEGATPTSHAADSGDTTSLTIVRKAVYVQFSDLARKAANITVEEIAKAMVMAQAKEIDSLIFGVTTGTTDYTTSAGATNAALSITHVLAGLNLLELNEVDDSLYAVVHPFQYKSIRSALTPVANDDAIAIGIADVMNKEAFVSRAYGINWFKTNRISKSTVDATANVYNGLLFSKRGIGYAFSWLAQSGLETNREPKGAYDDLIINWADSAGIIYSSAVCELDSTSA